LTLRAVSARIGAFRGTSISKALTALIVDQDAEFVSKLRGLVETAGYDVIADTEFRVGRRRLYSGEPPAALIANVRLGEFNGIHLVYLAKKLDENIRALIYGEPHDAVLAREAQRAHAFYQRRQFLPFALGEFLKAGLPAVDRREPDGIDRRTSFRGGRRATDVPYLYVAMSGGV
jgi:DNA-binding NtrC family response regulator